MVKTEIPLEKPSLNELKHYGVLGMKWGVRKDRNKPKTPRAKAKPKNKKSYYDLQRTKYRRRGYTEKDADILARRRSQIRAAALIAGGVTIAAGAAWLARYYRIEAVDTTLKAGKKVWHITRDEIKDLEPGKQLYTTTRLADRFAYRWRLANPKGVEQFERTFELVKDIKIPSPKKGEKLYSEFLKNNKEDIRVAFKTSYTPDYTTFIRESPYFSKGESWRPYASYNETGEKVWKNFQKFLIEKGYQGILDQNNRTDGFGVESPTILFDAAGLLKETSRKSMGQGAGSVKTLIPTIRELGSPGDLLLGGSIASGIGLSIYDQTRTLDAYRKVYPNSSKTNKEILALASKGSLDPKVYNAMGKV